MFYITMLICNLLVPVIMLVAGIVMYKKPPNNINGLMGYRTKRSMKNQDTWAFAHKCCGKLWTIIGAVMLVTSVLAQLPFIKSDDDTIGMISAIIETVQIVIIFCSIFFVEKALKNNFDDNGNKK